MTLLAPGVMLLAASLTVPPLVVFYLLKLRRRPLRVTSTMFWEQAAHDLQVNVPLRWVRPSWLLLLHALILGLLLIAVGRPAIEGDGASSSRVFVLIDRSASMNALDAPEGRSRLEQAKRLAVESLETMMGGLEPPEVTVIAYSAEPVVMGPPSTSLGTVSAMIGAIEPTDQPADHARALGLVRSLTAGGGDEDGPADGPGRAGGSAQVVLVSDGGGLARVPFTGLPVRIVPVEPAGGVSGSNTGIVAFSAERDIEQPERVRVFVRLMNTGSSPAAAPLVVSVDDVPVSRTPVTIPASGGGLGVGPGERVETVSFDLRSGGLLRVVFENTDVLESDDGVQAVLPPVDRPPVLLVVPPARDVDDPLEARGRADPFLLDVLEAIGSAGLRVIDSDRYARTDEAERERFGLIVFDRVAPRAAPTQPTLSFGTAWPGLGEQPVLEAASVGRTPVLAWDRSHPVMADAVLDTVVVADRLSLPEDDTPIADEAEGLRDRRTLARGRDGPLILELDDAGTGRIVVGFALEQSNWPVHFSFPMFMLAAFDRLSPGATSAVWTDTATPTTARLDRPVRALRLDGPVSRSIRLPGEEGATVVPLGLLGRVGEYRLVDEDGESMRTIAVNLADPEESSLRKASPELADRAAVSEGVVSDEPREIWRFFVLAAGLVLLVEWLVFAAQARG